MRIALCQIPVSPDPAVNLARVKSALTEAAAGHADLAVFPEATMARFGSDLVAAAEPLDGPFGTGVSAACAATGVAAIVGVFEPADGGGKGDHNAGGVWRPTPPGCLSPRTVP